MRAIETSPATRAATKRKPSRRTRINPATLEDNVGVRIVRLAHVFTRLAKIAVEEPWGLRNTDLRILNILDGVESVPIGEIAGRTHVDKAWISRSVQQLVAKGLVERRVDSEDSRVSLAALTVQGRALLDQIRPFVLSSEGRVLDGINGRSLKRDLDRLLNNAEAMLEMAEQIVRRC
jgi:DNA-binding MarR family transcriptional regulator